MSEQKDDKRSLIILDFSSQPLLGALSWSYDLDISAAGQRPEDTHEWTAIAQPGRVEMSVSRSNISNGMPRFRRHWASVKPLNPAPIINTRSSSLSELIVSSQVLLPRLTVVDDTFIETRD
jgi:hypothetical protein